MATVRGFVEGLEIGRAGLGSAFIIHADGSRATYTIADLDADPERFNERLSKLGLLRDAMDRAEPVEIEFESGDGDLAGQILRVRRLTRDALVPPDEQSRVSGSVIGVGVTIRHAPDSPEPSDQATLALLVGSNVERFVIDMQTPERSAAMAMLDLARSAQSSGAILQIDFSVRNRTVLGMTLGDGRGGAGGQAENFAAYVESIAHLPITDLMLVSVTTGPPFQNAGNMVELVSFDPELRHLAVMRGSPEFALLEAALRDSLRIEMLAEALTGGRGNDDTVVADDPNANRVPAEETGLRFAINPETGEDTNIATSFAPRGEIMLVRGAKLCAPLCSASRPVWIRIDREALDSGPDAACAEGVPTSDLSPRTLHEIDLPYRAAWIAQGCFNHGVYRFEIDSDAAFELYVDDEKLCLFRDEEEEAWFGHACLVGEHEVRIAFDNWSCRRVFDIDVYRIR